MQKQQPVAAGRLVHHVAGHQHAPPPVGQGMEQRPQVAAKDRIQPDRRLVENEDVGFPDDHTRQRGPTALPTGQVAYQRIPVGGQVHALHRPLRVRPARPDHGREVAHVGGDGQVLVHARRLGHVPHPATQPGGTCRLTEHGHRPPGNDLHPHNGPDQRRLPRPRRPKQTDHLAGGNGGADVGQHRPAATIDTHMVNPHLVVNHDVRHNAKPSAPHDGTRQNARTSRCARWLGPPARRCDRPPPRDAVGTADPGVSGVSDALVRERCVPLGRLVRGQTDGTSGPGAVPSRREA